MLKLLTKYLKIREWFMIVAILGLIVLQVWLELKSPEYMRQITILIKQGSSMSDIWINGGYMLACAVASAVISIIVGFFVARISSGMAKRVRSGIFDKVQTFSKREMKSFSTASLITRSTNDVTQIQRFVAMGLQVLIKAPIMAVWAILKISGNSWQWSVATAVTVLVIMSVIIMLIVIVMPKFKRMQTLTDNLNRVTRENLTGLRVVRAYNAENYEANKFEKANGELTKTSLFANRMMSLLSPVMSLCMSGLTLAIYWIGAFIINGADDIGKMTSFGDMMAFSSYAILVVMAFIMLTMIFIMLPRASVSAKRINEILDTTPSVQDGTGEYDIHSPIKGEIEFKNVSFKYPDADEYVLHDISFTAHKGETVAFIGSTGSGKSTLIDLVPRFYDATEGEVVIDGVNVKDYKLADLHNKLGYVSQKAFLFSGTVSSNISFGDDIDAKPTEEEIQRATKIAQAKSFIEKMPEGYNSTITQGGTNVSGGQKERLSIARAIARNPEIFIFDDSFSALDYKTDKKLRGAINKHLSNATCLIVAQRIGTIKNADKIIVLDQGNMVGMGTHEELLKTCEVYKEIALSQLSKEEL